MSSGQNASFAAGAVAGVPEALVESVTGLVGMLAHPVDTFNAIKEIIQQDDSLGLIADSLKQDYLQRIDRYLEAYQKAGATGSFNAGREAGKLLTDAASIVAGGAGIAKGGAVLTQKLTKVLKGSIAKGSSATSTANIAKGSQSGVVNTGKGTGNKPLGLGSTGRNTPANLNEKLALEQAISNPNAGRQLPVPMMDKRWPASEGWVKMSQNINGIEVHYLRNTKTGAIDDFKFK